MKREQMEHILRAAGAITNQRVFVVVGSQAVLAELEEAAQNSIRQRLASMRTSG